MRSTLTTGRKLVARMIVGQPTRLVTIALATALVLTVAAGAYGYGMLSKTVVLSVDGKPGEVQTLASTVGDVLDAQGIKLGEHDAVAPARSESISDGTRISVRYGRRLELTVDGKPTSYWVKSTTVAGALAEIGEGYDAAELSVSRSSAIGRAGMDLEVVTLKDLRVRLGARKPRSRSVAAVTVREALTALEVPFDADDRVKPPLTASLADGDKIVV
ncbi:MAG: ubiquitin-like domain-containing protein, partial [Nocardioides sp.]